MDAVLYKNGLDLCLKLSSSTQNPHTVPVGVGRCAFPWINAHHHSVLLGEENMEEQHDIITFTWFQILTVCEINCQEVSNLFFNPISRGIIK